VRFHDNRTFVELAAWLEQVVGIEDYLVDGISLWPVVRIGLAFALQDCDSGLDPAVQDDPLLVSHRAVTRDKFAGIPISPPFSPLAAPAPAVASRSVLPQGGVDAVIFTRSCEHYLRHENSWLAPVLDPWMDALSQGASTIKVELADSLSVERPHRRFPTFQLHPSAGPPATPADLAFDARARAVLSVLCARVETLAADMGVAGFTNLLQDHLARILRTRRIFRHLFAQLRPKAVFFNCYYHPEALGAIWAAHDRAAQVVDIQHGNNGEYHFAYTHWLHMPPGGHYLLPDVFATWNQACASNINRWLPAPVGRHRAVVTGRLDIATILPGGAAGIGESVEALDMIRQGYARTILVTLQGSEWTGLTPVLVEAIRQAPPDWLWLIRGHPMAQVQGGTLKTVGIIEQRLNALGLTHVETRLATTLPLPALLACTDHHVTHFSTTALESITVGVATTLIHPFADIFFGRDIQNRVFHHATRPTDILKTIHAGLDGLDASAMRQAAILPAIVEPLLGTLLSPGLL
jgi:hypothetical protein